MSAEILGELDAVPGDAIEIDIGRVCTVAAVRVAGTALVPLHHDEVLFPLPVKFGLRPLRFARTSMDNQQHGVLVVVSSNADPLIDTTKPHKHYSIDFRR